MDKVSGIRFHNYMFINSVHENKYFQREHPVNRDHIHTSGNVLRHFIRNSIVGSSLSHIIAHNARIA